MYTCCSHLKDLYCCCTAANLAVLQLLLLENVRFYKEEEKNEPEFAKKVNRRVSIYFLVNPASSIVAQILGISAVVLDVSLMSGNLPVLSSVLAIK